MVYKHLEQFELTRDFQILKVETHGRTYLHGFQNQIDDNQTKLYPS